MERILDSEQTMKAVGKRSWSLGVWLVVGLPCVNVIVDSLRVVLNVFVNLLAEAILLVGVLHDEVE